MNDAGAEDIDRSSKKDGLFYNRRAARASSIIRRNAKGFSHPSFLLVAVSRPACAVKEPEKPPSASNR
jgi:hypothetical protein